MKNKTSLILVVLILMLSMSLAACGKKSESSGGASQSAAASPEASGDSAAKQGPNPADELEKLMTKVLTKGPNGEVPVSADTLEITSEDIAKLKEKKITAAIAMHYMGNDWSTTQVSAIKEEMARLGIEIIGVTDGNFKPEKQTSDIETLLAKKPDILLSIPTDGVAMAPIFKKAAEQGTKIVFMAQAADGMKAGQDYVTIVSPDDYGNGAASAHMMARELGGKGKIGIIYHEADYPTTKIRYQAFSDVIKQYPGIEVVEEQGVAGPDFAGDAEKAASAFLIKHPDLKGIWGVWDIPAEGIMAAARNSGREDLVITTIDLGKNVAIEMAKGGMIKGLGAQGVYQAGIAEAKAGALAVLGKEVPPFLVVNGIPVDKDNLLASWKKVYNVDAPKEVADAMNK
ncbi:substrate-binding domain-containing protein [Cohnella yongneupensis]|uniref:Substrate-binding domain-containing protein n=1 Tax=Cohnella yongneupensis TaxID=425006 RepID=A0ABW0QZC6_9BACL